MTSQINSANIDGTYPIAGQDNSTQGFRTNFTNIKNNFTYAAAEISDLQSKAILKASLTGNASALSTVNDMGGAPLRNAEVLGQRETIYDFGIVSGFYPVNYRLGSYFTIELGGSFGIDEIQNWPSSGVQARIRVEVTVPNVNYTFTIPDSVTQNYSSIAGISTRTITFQSIGVYIFEFSTVDGGVNVSIQDLTRNKSTVDSEFAVLADVNSVTTVGVRLTAANIAGAIVGNIYANNVIADNLINTGSTSLSLTGNITGGNIISNANIYGTIMTPIQSNITLLGNLSSLSVTGNANVGNLTVTGLTDMCGGDSYGIQYVTAINSSSSTIYSNVGAAIIDSSGTIGSYTLTMPTTPMNGQTIRILFGNTITTLTHTSTGGQTLKSPLTTGSNSAGGQWMYYSTNSTWYRLS